MKNKQAKLIWSVFVATIFTGCSTTTPRTKWTDKTMRIMIDPESIDAQNYVKVQHALVNSGKWIVVDRRDGFKAIKKEQEMLHRNESDRYEDREKYALWGKLYGVGGVVVAHSQCTRYEGFLPGQYNHCRQNLAIMDTNNGEVLAVSEATSDSDDWTQMPSWEESVAILNDNFPKHFVRDMSDEKLLEYKDLAREEAVRQKENLVNEIRTPASKKPKQVAPEAPVETPVVDAPKPDLAPKIIDKVPEAPKAEAPKPEAKDKDKEESMAKTALNVIPELAKTIGGVK